MAQGCSAMNCMAASRSYSIQHDDGFVVVAGFSLREILPSACSRRADVWFYVLRLKREQMKNEGIEQALTVFLDGFS
jgi:hypothetical protein